MEPIITKTFLEPLEIDEYYEINKKKKNIKPRFIMIGTEFDLLKEIANMNANEKLAFFAIKDKLKYSPLDNKVIYQVKISMKDFTKSQTSKFSNGFKSLEAKNILKRISRGIYMINPDLLIPINYEDEVKLWLNK